MHIANWTSKRDFKAQKMDYLDMEESDAFFNSCRTRALHDFNDVLEQSLELSKDVLDALVENQLISNHVKDMLSGVRI